MLTARTDHALKFATPGTGVHGKTRGESFFGPGGPIAIEPQNGSLSTPVAVEKNFPQNDSPSTPTPSEKNSTKNDLLSYPEIKNSEISIIKSTPQEGVIVKKGEYTAAIGEEMYSWFSSKPKFNVTYDSFVWKNGQVEEKKRNVPCPPPHFSEFARSIGVTWKTLKAWKKTHREFADYYEACEDIIQEFYIDNGVTGAYAGQFSIFAAKNTTKMKDVQINKNENYNMRDVLDAIEKNLKLEDPNDI